MLLRVLVPLATFKADHQEYFRCRAWSCKMTYTSPKHLGIQQASGLRFQILRWNLHYLISKVKPVRRGNILSSTSWHSWEKQMCFWACRALFSSETEDTNGKWLRITSWNLTSLLAVSDYMKAEKGSFDLDIVSSFWGGAESQQHSAGEHAVLSRKRPCIGLCGSVTGGDAQCIWVSYRLGGLRCAFHSPKPPAKCIVLKQLNIFQLYWVSCTFLLLKCPNMVWGLVTCSWLRTPLTCS